MSLSSCRTIELAGMGIYRLKNWGKKMGKNVVKDRFSIIRGNNSKELFLVPLYLGVYQSFYLDRI